MQKLAVVFGGGAAHGAYQAGVWQVLGPYLAPSFVMGSSIGALNALATTKMTPDAIATWWQHYGDTPHTGLAFSRRNYRRVLQTLLNLPTQQPWAALVVSTRMNDLRPVVTRIDQLAAADQLAWLLASASMPGVFLPVRIGNTDYVDGGVVNDLPVDIARQVGASTVLAIDGAGIGRIGADHGDFFVTPSQRLPRLFNFSGKAVAMMIALGRQDAQDFVSQHAHETGLMSL